MPLDTATKTVLLHDGPFDESDRFLLRAPATDYIENQHFHQNGSLKKRAGNTLLGTVPNATGTPIALHAIGDSLHVLTQEGARAWDGASWSEANVTGFIGTKSMALETPPVGGMNHVDTFLEYDNGVLQRYVVAYEVREESSSESPDGFAEPRDKHVIVQTYSPSGEFLTQFRVNDAQSPKLTGQFVGGSPLLWFQRVSSTILFFGTVGPDGTAPSFVNTGLLVATTAGIQSHGTTSADKGPMWITRLGASAANIARYQVALDTDNTSYLVFYRSVSPTAGLFLTRFNGFGVKEDTKSVVPDGGITTASEPLDIVYAGNAECYLLLASYVGTLNKISSATIRRHGTTGAMDSVWTGCARQLFCSF